MRSLFRNAVFAAAAVMVLPGCAAAQWTLQESHTGASLRGIDYIGDGVAWASGSGGTVLRTTDMGKTWAKCAVPDGAEKLDFRGVQAFGAETAIVMSSGLGDLSRLYKTTDGCKTWKLVFTNPDKDGFWDALVAKTDRAFLIGDPVDGRFVFYTSRNSGLERWDRFGEKNNLLRFPYSASPKESLFAASNSVLEGDPIWGIAFITGGESGSRFYLGLWNEKAKLGHIDAGYFEADLPFEKGISAGAFSFAGRRDVSRGRHYVVVGGDYTKPEFAAATAAFSTNGGKSWKSAKSFPHGYRSAVTYFTNANTWITVGPNGTDISTDDGRNWRPLTPGPNDTPDADKNWNALSLPFVVGSKGRIGLLREDAIKSAGASR